MKADDAARDSRKTKQDRYEEMRRRKDEEHEARERKLVVFLINFKHALKLIYDKST